MNFPTTEFEWSSRIGEGYGKLKLKLKLKFRESSA